MMHMKWLQFIALIFITSCGVCNKVAFLEPSEDCLTQQIRVIDAQGPNGEDSIIAVMFKTAAGDIIKLREECPIKTGKKDFYLIAIPRLAQAGNLAESITLTNEIRMALVNSMKQYVASTLHINTLSSANLQKECDHAQFGSFRHALLVMLIDMQSQK